MFRLRRTSFESRHGLEDEVRKVRAGRRRARFVARTLGIFLLVLPVITLLSLVFSRGEAARASVTSTTYTWTGSSKSWTVPAGVSLITVVANGGAGGNGGNDNSDGGAGGPWGRAGGTISVTQGDVIRVLIGGAGGNGSGCVANTGAGSGGGSEFSGMGGGAGGAAGNVGC